MVSKVKVDAIESTTGSGTIALNNQLSGMTVASLPTLTTTEMPAGSVIQVVNFTKPGSTTSSSSLLATTSTTFATFMNASITPRSTSNKILIMVNSVNYNAAASTTTTGELRLLRGSTEIDALVYGAFYKFDNDRFNTMSFSHLDSSHSSTSSITYYVQGRWTQGGNLYFGYGDNSGGDSASLTLMEIKG